MKNFSKKILLFFISLLYLTLLGCTSDIKFYPNDLPIATVGQTYYVEIEIKGGNPVAPRSFFTKIEPENGLKIEPINLDEAWSHNHLKIFGTPRNTGNIKLIISGATYGTNYKGSEFQKTYIIKVKEAEK